MLVGFKKIGDKGDTIIEVLISILIVSSVLTISLATMNRNLKISQMNQERTEAYSLAKGQLETLKSETEEESIVQSNFCFTEAGDIATLSGTPNANLDNDNLTVYGTNCTYSDRYKVGITRTAARNYTIYVRWENLSAGKDQVVMSYRTVN